jgi:1-aminocyclopropane-1-carboxylate deaminase/D-cysteine desulfhydrase-like pyridoxal-dependent ACC family enzyme
MLPDYSNIETEVLHSSFFNDKNITLSVLRLDKTHPIISGNKLFKLHYFLEKAILSAHNTIITFGGAYSNHLAATAYACKIAGLKSIGIVRGEQPITLSHTLQQCLKDAMQLKFISREMYDKKDNNTFLQQIVEEFGKSTVIPEGGYHPLGAKGASLIMDLLPKNVTHICCSLGTATTIAGLMLNNKKAIKIIGVPSLKGMTDLESRISFLTENKIDSKQLQVLPDYHFGGYAKKTPELISFMNELYNQYRLKTDFVYTAKMFFAIFDQVNKNVFNPGSNVVCLHTGGLQGNHSLPTGTLFFD